MMITSQSAAAALMTGFIIVALECAAFAEGSFLRYENRKQGWSISYPPGWVVKDDDGDYPRLQPPSSEATCGIHQWTVESGNLDQLTNTMQSFMMEYLLRENNLFSVEKSRNRVTLSSGQPGLEVVVDLVPVARSSRLFVGPFRGRFFLIDCESYVVNWSLYEDSFKAIQKSFRLSGV